MSLTFRKIAVVGSREFKNFRQLKRIVESFLEPDDWIISGGAIGADSFAQRLAKEKGRAILIFYPLWYNEIGEARYFDKGGGFKRNEKIAREADIVLAFYQKGRFQQGGTANTAMWAKKLGKELHEYEEE